jgi:hypothetical protein
MVEVSRRIFMTGALAGVPAVALARFAAAQEPSVFGDELSRYLLGELRRNAQLFRSSQEHRRRAQAAHAIGAATEALFTQARAKGRLAAFDAQRHRLTVAEAHAGWMRVCQQLEEFGVAPFALPPQTFQNAVRGVQRTGIDWFAWHVRGLIDTFADKVDDPAIPVVVPARRQYEVWAEYCGNFDCEAGVSRQEMAYLCYFLGVAAVLSGLAGLPEIGLGLGVFVALVCPFFPM